MQPTGRRFARSLCILILALGAAGPGRADTPSAADDDAAARAGATLERLLETLWSISRSSAPEDQKRDALARRLAAHLDYPVLARRALGDNAERFTREQYADFSHAYARFVTGLLVDRIAGAEQPPELVETRHDEASDTVQALVLGRERRKPFRYQRNAPDGRSEIRVTLRESYGEWRMTAIRIDAVDATRSFHDQFESVLSRSDPDALIAELRRRNRGSEAPPTGAEEPATP